MFIHLVKRTGLDGDYSYMDDDEIYHFNNKKNFCLTYVIVIYKQKKKITETKYIYYV